MSNFSFTFHFHALEKEMVTPHSSVLAWRIPGTGQPSGLPSLGSHRVGHDWSDLAAATAAVTLEWKLWLSAKPKQVPRHVSQLWMNSRWAKPPMNSWLVLPWEETHNVPLRRICTPEELSGLENRSATCAQSFFNNLFNDNLIIHSAFLGEE